MDHVTKLVLVGYWDGPETTPGWPSPADFVDHHWDADIRERIVDYLSRGHVVRAYMGYSTCRICGVVNGDLELSDGTFVWPDGLGHYVAEHAVRLPESFVRHAIDRSDHLETVTRDTDWWMAQGRGAGWLA